MNNFIDLVSQDTPLNPNIDWLEYARWTVGCGLICPFLDKVRSVDEILSENPRKRRGHKRTRVDISGH